MNSDSFELIDETEKEIAQLSSELSKLYQEYEAKRKPLHDARVAAQSRLGAAITILRKESKGK